MWDMSWDASVQIAHSAMGYGQFVATGVAVLVLVVMAVVYIKWELSKGA